MILLINILSYLVVISFFVSIFYLLVYGILWIIQKIKKIKILNDTWLKLKYILISMPFVILGLYILSLSLTLEKSLDIIVMIIFGLFLVIYPIFKCISKIKDIYFFKGLNS